MANTFNIIDVRFRNQGLDSIEVQDNGSGISPDNYETIALKHYTSKLSTYSDLATLQTFGFRGEALSSLCALSQFSILTCLAQDVPKGTKLEFEASGKLKRTHVVAAQKGTNVIVEDLFRNLPVRRRELERNIKREWNKVISLLNQYACIQTGVKFTVSQQPSKGKRIVLFSTKGNPSTRENLINIFGTKTMAVLVQLDMTLEFEPTPGPGMKSALKDNNVSTEVRVQGYVSRPAHGEGRQTPDRQMFFVNARPCGLPQFAKVFNEVYRAYNSSQSPFIFADIQLDTHLYDVNVSPDKRTILMHDQNRMLENLREALVSLFQSQDYSIPIAQPSTQKAQRGAHAVLVQDDSGDEERSSKRPPVAVEKVAQAPQTDDSCSDEEDDEVESASRSAQARRTRKTKSRRLAVADPQSQSLIRRWVGLKADEREGMDNQTFGRGNSSDRGRVAEDPMPRQKLVASEEDEGPEEEAPESLTGEVHFTRVTTNETPQKVLDFRARLADADSQESAETPLTGVVEARNKDRDPEQAGIPAITPLRAPGDTDTSSTTTSRLSKRPVSEVATVIIGDPTVAASEESRPKRVRVDFGTASKQVPLKSPSHQTPISSSFGTQLSQMFSAAQSSGKQTKSKVGSERPVETDDGDAHETVDEPNSNSSPVRESSDQALETASVDEEPPATSGIRSEPSSLVSDIVADSPGYDKERALIRPATGNEQPQGPLPDQVNNLSNRPHLLRTVVKRKDATLQYRQSMKMSEADLKSRVESWVSEPERTASCRKTSAGTSGIDSNDAEEVLSLIISKADFGKMRIVGQFNLGFIIAVRQASRDPDDGGSTGADELFIIDQHASDEKYNFERLQTTTVVQSQRLVHPKQLELTALEEEIVRENVAALDVNGFKVHLDDSGDVPVGSRCKLLALPLSRDTTFTLSDLEELISLLGEHHSSDASYAPRPSKVRSMFAMRACRSSVMIGKALAHRQMEKLVRHMGELDKPWNCPHGRPTMRHLSGLGAWDENGWRETESRVNWARYARS
ncbi:putative DNA mismatch repair protein MutL [Colletotrichum karsti]|uniref:DNA mismatch repair protein MutL n=1 Tax=Colletotrichum karsti TaxID=1095194 RepID=A0A9P6IFB3_9PEZI|nr:putative DNA mismatch repair protein MutL [Colletotrichum karsti]KAF9881394.1 putative DNA mismatch repair protein MutL [Colletotrichum karsti]